MAWSTLIKDVVQLEFPVVTSILEKEAKKKEGWKHHMSPMWLTSQPCRWPAQVDRGGNLCEKLFAEPLPHFE